jgi:hypothetical protein
MEGEPSLMPTARGAERLHIAHSPCRYRGTFSYAQLEIQGPKTMHPLLHSSAFQGAYIQ